MNKNNLITALLGVFIAGFTYYFIVVKKGIIGSGSSTLSASDAASLTYSDVQGLSLSQVKSALIDQASVLTSDAKDWLLQRKTTLEAQAANDAKAIAQAAENARIEALKATMSKYTPDDIDVLTLSQLNAFTTEQVNYMLPATKTEYTLLKNLLQRQYDFQTGLKSITSARKGELNKLAADIAFHFVSWFHASHVAYFDTVNKLPDAELYYFIHTAYPAAEIGHKDGFLTDMHFEDSNGVDSASKKAGYTQSQLEVIMGQIRARSAELDVLVQSY